MREWPVVAVIDPNAGHDVGHHRHWLELIQSAFRGSAEVVVVNADAPIRDRRERDRWYQSALASRIPEGATDIVLMSGDDAMISVLRHVWPIRTARIASHLFLFRADPQPGARGRLAWIARRLSLRLLRIAAPETYVYELRLPTYRGGFLEGDRTASVVDSSHLEVRKPVGKEACRARTHLDSHGFTYYLVIGMLGPGKHVDTLLNAWRSNPDSKSVLVLVGESDSRTHQAISQAKDELGDRLLWEDGRVSDDKFDDYLEASDFVFTLYRYSASSGVVLRSLALGTPVLYGGSAVLRRDLIGVDGAYEVPDVGIGTVLSAIQNTEIPIVPSPSSNYPAHLVFPRPIVDRVLARSQARH